MFRFKQFSVEHDRSAMKIGVDAVLLGSWTSIKENANILDVGTGCGVIALMLAQRCRSAQIVGLDIYQPGVEEAHYNFQNSPWPERLRSCQGNFIEWHSEISFDLIVSNPPYFDSGLEDISSPRLRARHQNELSPYSLLRRGKELLADDGEVAMVIPAWMAVDVVEYAHDIGYGIRRQLYVRGNDRRPLRRYLVQFTLSKEVEKFLHVVEIADIDSDEHVLTLEHNPGQATEAHRNLCAPFYLKF